MAYTTQFIDIDAASLLEWVSARKQEGWAFVQLAATAQEAGTDVFYTFRREDVVLTATVRGLAAGEHIPSITGLYLAAFVFENEVHDLFGVAIDGIAIDFAGKFYNVAQDAPMSIVTPEKLAQRQRAAKLAAAAAVKAADKPVGQPVVTKQEDTTEVARQKRQAIREGRLAEWERQRVEGGN